MRSGLRRDILWGLRRGLFITGIVLVPGTIAFALEWLNGDTPDLSRFVTTIATYLASGGIVGVCAGLFRTQIASRIGATIFGFCIGSAASVALLLKLRPPGEPFNAKVDVVFGFMGALAGAFLGWSIWTTLKRHSQIERDSP